MKKTNGESLSLRDFFLLDGIGFLNQYVTFFCSTLPDAAELFQLVCTTTLILCFFSAKSSLQIFLLTTL